MTPDRDAIVAYLVRRARQPMSSVPFCPHEPHPKQREFLELRCLEALYGGAAGGGKSDALLMAALQHVGVAGYSALILRRSYADLALPEAIMDRAKTWLVPQRVEWNDRDKRFTFPSGATLSFGYLDNDRDKFRYQSAAFQYIGWDELTQFPEPWYRYLFSRLRKLEGAAVPLRMRSASNPGGIGHKWVKRRFLDEPGDRRFVPALMADNPSLDAEEYRRSLAELDSTTRRQLEHGVWVQDSSGLVYHFDAALNVVAEDNLPPLDRHILAIDFGFTDSTAFTILGWAEADPRVFVLKSWKEAGLIPSSVGEIVQHLSRALAFDAVVGDVGGLGKGYAEEMRQRFSIPLQPAKKENKRGYISLLNGAFERGEVVLVKGHTDSLQLELEELPWNEERSAPAEGFEDHCADSLLYGWRAAKAFAEVADEEIPAEHEPSPQEAAVERWRERQSDDGDWLLRRFGR